MKGIYFLKIVIVLCKKMLEFLVILFILMSLLDFWLWGKNVCSVGGRGFILEWRIKISVIS